MLADHERHGGLFHVFARRLDDVLAAKEWRHVACHGESMVSMMPVDGHGARVGIIGVA